MRIALFGLRASFKAELAKHRVPWSVWYYLRVLWEHDGISQRELTERVGVMQPNTVSALQTMSKAGWVMIARGEDRRSTLVRLTPKGRRLMQRMLPEILRGGAAGPAGRLFRSRGGRAAPPSQQGLR